MGLDEVTLRSACPEDSERCQAIAVMAWQPIHDEKRRLVGDAIYEQITGDWRAAKARAVAHHINEHPDWTVVACAAGGVSTDEAEAGSGATGAPGTAEKTRAVEQVVGFVTFRLDHGSRVGTIGNNAVDPAWQGHGIAGRLYQHVLARFREEGMKVAAVTTGLDAGHAPALAAYRKAGFGAEVPSVTLHMEL
jgi:ribosomal protein S18 acetylase RimI-like enzyme